jgi:hypothetical protein
MIATATGSGRRPGEVMCSVVTKWAAMEGSLLRSVYGYWAMVYCRAKAKMPVRINIANNV